MFDSGSIVVPLDGTSPAEAAVSVAVALARLYEAPLRFVHVVDEDLPLTAPAGLSDGCAAFGAYVSGLMGAANANDLARDVEVHHGPAARIILDVASDARLIVIASRGRGGLRGVLGSVADRVVRGSTVPVLVVPAEGNAPLAGGVTVVGVDGSPAAEEGLAAARAISRKLATGLILVRAFSASPLGPEFVSAPVDLYTPMKEGAEAYLRETESPAERAFAVAGSAVDAIDRVARQEHASLVVMASHGKGFARRITLGSQTDRAMHSLHRPLLVIPVHEQEPALTAPAPPISRDDAGAARTPAMVEADRPGP